MRAGRNGRFGTARFITLTAVPLLLAALLAVPSSCGSGEEAGPAFDDQTRQAIEKTITDVMAAEGIPGVIAGVWVPGRGSWVGALGEADIDTGEAMDPAFTVRIASNTKTYTATAVLQLAEEGRLSLEDTLDQYVPEIPGAGRITVRQLLNMTGGIYSYSEDEEFGRVFDTEPLKVWTEREILDIILAHQPDFEPGAGWHYSDSNYYLLGMIIEQVTGNSAEAEIEDRIAGRLGLDQTWFPTGPDMPGEYAHGYMPAAGGGSIVEMTRVDPSAPWTGGAMVSGLEDMRAYVEALARGDLLGPAMQEERLQLVEVPESGIGYGLGIASIKGFLGHTGAINGYNSVMFSDPDTGATIIVIANKSTNSSAEAVEIFIGLGRLLFPGLFPQETVQASGQETGGQEAEGEGEQAGPQDEAAADGGGDGGGADPHQKHGETSSASMEELQRRLGGEVDTYPGAAVDTSGGASRKMEEAGGGWILLTGDPLEVVVRFYEHELRGMNDYEKSESSGATSFSGRDGRGRRVRIVISPAGSAPGEGTHVVVAVEG